MKRFFQVFILILSLDSAVAAPDPSVGARISVAAAQDLLISPPLPSLENGGGQRATPQVGYMSAKTEGSEDGSAQSSAYSFKGELKGYSAGFGFTSPPRGRAGAFAMLAVSSLQGEITATDPAGANLFTLSDMTSQVIAGAAGISYRFIGDSNSSVAMGYFLGPAFMSIQSSFKASSAGSSVGTIYQLNPLIYGAYGGLQLKLRMGKFLINPYALYFYDATDKCKSFEGEAAAMPGLCDGKPEVHGSIDLNSKFYGYGLFLGYRKVRFNVYTKSIGSSLYDDIKITNYSISYSFGVDI